MRIVCDVDEVVMKYIESACDFYNEVYRGDGDKRLEVSDFCEYDFKSVMGVGEEEKNMFMRAHYESNYFDRMRLVGGAREGVESLAREDELFFATVRPCYMNGKTRACFDREMPSVYRDVYFCVEPKDVLCRELRAGVIIEDSVFSLGYAERGMNVVLFDKIWNRGIAHPNIYRCSNWVEIVDKVGELRNV